MFFDSRVLVICFPSHASADFQPLDVTVFAVFKLHLAKLYRKESLSRFQDSADAEEFSEITQVLNHRFKGSKKNLANLELYLTWEDDPKPQWFPWNSSFRSVEVIHRYFEDNQMRRFIPTEFTWGKDHPEYIPPNHSRKQRS